MQITLYLNLSSKEALNRCFYEEYCKKSGRYLKITQIKHLSQNVTADVYIYDYIVTEYRAVPVCIEFCDLCGNKFTLLLYYKK